MSTPETIEAVRAFVRQCLTRLSELEDDSPPVWTERPQWIRGSDGHFRKHTHVLREIPAQLVFELESMPDYDRVGSLLRADAIIGSHLDTLVGDRGGQHRLEPYNVILSLVRDMLDVTGSTGHDEERFGQAWGKLISSFEVERIARNTIVVIPNLALTGGPIQLEDDLALDVLTDDEVTRCERLGVLRPVMPDFPMIMSEMAVGVRLSSLHDKLIGEREAVPEGAGRFGARTASYPHLVAEDVLCLLRLFQPCALKCAGYVSYTEWKWLAGASAYRVTSPAAFGGAPYEISASEHEGLLDLWRRLVAVSHMLDFAIRRYSLAFDRESLEDRIVDLVVAAESFFLGDTGARDRGELRFRFALRAAWFIDHPNLDRRNIFALMRRAYDARSAIVHGGAPEDLRVPGHESGSVDVFAAYIAELVRVALQKALVLTADGIALRRSEFWTELVLPAAVDPA